MSILRLPVEIVALLVDELDVESIFNLGSTCRRLSYILYDRRICRLALLKVRFRFPLQLRLLLLGLQVC